MSSFENENGTNCRYVNCDYRRTKRAQSRKEEGKPLSFQNVHEYFKQLQDTI